MVVVTALVAALLAGSSLIAPAPEAEASGDASAHFCDLFSPNDDGPLTDPLHHSLEPFVPGLHQQLCGIQATINGLSCTLTFLAPLRGTTGTFPPCLGTTPIL